MGIDDETDPTLVPETSIGQFRHYRATVRIRRGDGWEVRPEAEALDGTRYTFMASWVMDDDDPYPGEWAMTFEDPGATSLLWVASGDLVDIVSVDPTIVSTEDEFWDHVTRAVLERARRDQDGSMGIDDKADPMLAKAEALEEELLRVSKTWSSPHTETWREPMRRAALLIQQLRVRIQGEGHTHGK